MGDRGATATVQISYCAAVHCSRWEIGEQPQLPSARSDPGAYCSRWEIGEQPQPRGACDDDELDCSRWEIGEQPQHGLLEAKTSEIVADGRSGSNRNAVGALAYNAVL